MIYQELTNMPSLTVAENVFLGRQYTNKFGLIDWGRMRKDAADALHRLGIDIDVTQRMGQLSLGNQQLVEIARIILSGAEIIVLDEPTSALSGPESERLFGLMRQLKARGTSMIFICHFLEDVLAVSDRVTILKNSRKVAELENAGLTKAKLIELMIGRDATALAESYEGGTQLPPRVDGRDRPSGRVALGAGRIRGRHVRRQARRDPRHVRLPRRRHDRGRAVAVRPAQAIAGDDRAGRRDDPTDDANQGEAARHRLSDREPPGDDLSRATRSTRTSRWRI